MQFFKITIYKRERGNETYNEMAGRLQKAEEKHLLDTKFQAFSKDVLEDNGRLFLARAWEDSLECAMVARTKLDVENVKKELISFTSLEITNIISEEITFDYFNSLIHDSYNNGFHNDINEFMEDYGIYELGSIVHGFTRLFFEERIFPEISRMKILSQADRTLVRESFNEELNRIFDGSKRKNPVGQPVLYMLESDNMEMSEEVIQLLLQALFDAGRILNRRYSLIWLNDGEDSYKYNKKGITALYKMSVCGTVIFGIPDLYADEKNIAKSEEEIIENICDVARQYHNEVLTVFCMPKGNGPLKKKIIEFMDGCTFVEILEKPVRIDKAAEYLQALAKNKNIRTDKKLLSQIKTGKEYQSQELNAIFDDWFSNKLKTSVYKQYKDFKKVNADFAKEKPKGTAYDELNEMIGLTSVKKVINEALDDYKATRIFGLVGDEKSRHMIFTGNPGTAKTTVARLFARIMQENDILKTGQIIEVGRGDLVGKYVGWTAKNIQQAFKRAKGGVLFIDEAYSLVDDRDGSYGDEAINTIVQEMENMRDEVIVIFAGYPDKMEGFINKNPGLKSRIAYQINFDDYTPDELCQIARLIAKKKGVELDSGATAKIHSIMEQAVLDHDFGNGRYVRNVIERAKTKHNSRLVHMDIENITEEEVKTITAEDIDMPVAKVTEIRRIGFAVGE